MKEIILKLIFILSNFIIVILSIKYDNSLPLPLYTHHLKHRKPLNIKKNRFLQFKQTNSFLNSLSTSTELTPLYIGYGTHISYIYVGNPPQRQSVIIDTGSSATAFPCTGCSQCGDHTDSYFEPNNSSTSFIPRCGLSTCPMSQAYSEGSSWRAYKVIDEVYVGSSDIESTLKSDNKNYKVNMTFGCQVSETGLFRTQLADGIMGLTRSESTLPHLLHSNKITSSKIFALCYRIGGGIFTIGGVDQSIHLTETTYTSLLPSSSGWYGITIKEISFRDRVKGDKVKLNVGEKIINSDAIIVDSGTTDTYLPSSLSTEFGRIFHDITGFKYSNNGMTLTSEQISKMPDIIFTIQDQSSNELIDLVMPVTSYTDIDSRGNYVFRVYLTESSGGVLGSNFMNNYNIIFDADNNRIGFAQSTCRYESFDPALKPPIDVSPPPPPTIIEEDQDSTGNITKCLLKPLKYCTATCSVQNSKDNYIAYGNQTFINECTKQLEVKDCFEFCRKDNTIARGIDLNCLNTQWTECNKDCKQYRTIVSISDNRRNNKSFKTENITISNYNNNNNNNNYHRHHRRLSDKNKCRRIQQERDCYVDDCPLSPEDFFILADLKFTYPPVLPPGHWDKIYEEDLFTAISSALKIPEGHLDILVDTTRSSEQQDQNEQDSSSIPSPIIHNSKNNYLKLQLQVVLPRKTFSRFEYFNNKIDEIVTYLTKNGRNLGTYLIPYLEEITANKDSGQLYRYVLMKSTDIVCQRAVSLPINNDRGENYLPPVLANNIITTNSHSHTDTEKILLIMVISLFLVLIVLGVIYYRLKLEHAALAKDKTLSSGKTLSQLWNKLKSKVSSKSQRSNNNSLSSSQHKNQDIMSSKGLLNLNRDASQEEDDEEYGL